MSENIYFRKEFLLFLMILIFVSAISLLSSIQYHTLIFNTLGVHSGENMETLVVD